MIEKDKLFDRVKQAELFSKRFGSFSKADYEVLMFTVYLDSLKEPAHDYDISLDLGITETKVRSLRVKSQLLYPREIHWVNELALSLEHGVYDSGTITITIEDPSVWNRIRHEVESQYGMIGLSLNSKQLMLPVESFLILAACAEQDPDEVLQRLNNELLEHEALEKSIHKQRFGSRFLKGVNDIGTVVQNVAAIYSVGAPIINAVLKLVKP